MPRSIWESKARPASIGVAEHRGYEFTNLSLPFHSEMNMEFGVIGMVLVMLLLGYFLGRIDQSWQVAPLSRAALMAPYISMAMLGVIRGPLGANVPVWLTVVGLLYLGLGPSSRRTASP